MATSCCRVAMVGAGDATGCARIRTIALVYTKRFLFLMMPKKRDCAKSVSESNSDLDRVKSWVLVLWSVAGSREKRYRLLHVRANGGECGCDVLEGLVKGGAREAYGEGDKFPPSQMFLEGCYKE